MDQIINDFTQALIPIVVAFIAAMLGLLINQARVWVARKVGAEQTALIEGVLSQAVRAAGQYLASAPGEQKKRYAIAHAQLALTQLGLTVNLTLLESWIEAALFDEKTHSAFMTELNSPSESPALSPQPTS